MTAGDLTGTTWRNLARVVKSSAASTIVNGAIGLLILPFVLHRVDVARYGEWSTLAAIMAIGSLAEAGVGTEITRRVADAWSAGHRDEALLAVRRGTTLLFSVALIIVVVGVASARPIVDGLFRTVPSGQKGQLVLLLLATLVLLAGTFVGNGYFSVLAGVQRSDFILWSNVTGVVVGAAATVGALAAGLGLWALLVGDAIQLVIRWIGSAMGVRRILPELGFRLTKVPWAIVVGFAGMPAMVVLSSASDLFDSQVDKLVLSHSVGPRASAMFQIGVNLVQGIRMLSVLPLGVLLAGTAELHRANPMKLRRLEDVAWSAAQAVVAFTTGAAILFAPAFLRVWLGAGYGRAAFSVQMLAGATLLNIWSAPWYFYAVGRGRYGYVAATASVTALVNLLATILLTAHIGLTGALIGSLAGQVVGGGFAWLLVRRWEHRRWLWGSVKATMTVALIVLPGLLLERNVRLSWNGILAWGALYGCLAGALLLASGSLPAQVRWTGRIPKLEWVR